MKILIISNLFPPGYIGGYELGAFDVAKGLSANGNEVHVLTSDYFLDDENETSFLNVSRTLDCCSITHEITQTDEIRHLYYNFRNIRILGSAIRRIKPDVVLSFNLHGLGIFSIIQYLQKIKMPMILYLMDNIFDGIDLKSTCYQQYVRVFGELQFSNTTRIIAMSENVLRQVSKTLNKVLKDVIFIPGWVDFNPNKAIALKTKQHDHLRFIFCSRVAEHKGIDIILGAVERLVRHGQCNFSIDIYGAGQVTTFLQRVKVKNLDPYITYQGLVAKKELLEVFSNYDALVFPTWEKEAFGFVASEAAVAGCYPIMTAGIGASEWFLDGYDCLKISRDAHSLSNAMLQIMSWSKDKLRTARYQAMTSGRMNFAFDRWISVIHQECINMKKFNSIKDVIAKSKGAESALLFLSTLLAPTHQI